MLIETQTPPVLAHGNLTGLGVDDHTQYLLADGSRDCSGDINFNNEIYALNGIYLDIYGGNLIESSSGDSFYYSYFGHTFYGSNPLRSMGGFSSSDGSAGITDTVPTSLGDCYFEDGLLVTYSVY